MVLRVPYLLATVGKYCATVLLPVAVRSSGIAEDGDVTSFAGQQETYLWVVGVGDVIEHVRACWASLYTPQAIAYRSQLPEDVAFASTLICVGVQAMVDAEVAGVAFTVSPRTGDRSVIAIDKPRGWMLVPDSWRKTNWNLQTAIDSSIRADDFWARSRNLTYLRHVHRLDADTSGVMLFAKSEGAMRAMGDMFESRRMEKTYLAVVEGAPKEKEWVCELPIGPDPLKFGKMMVDRGEEGKEAETHFRVLTSNDRFTLIEASPLTGRTHQIRLHLAESGSPIMCDEIYGRV